MPRTTVCVALMLLALATASADQPWEAPGTTAGDEITGPDGSTLVWAPAGEFVMGRDDGGFGHEPAHTVRLSGFWIGKHEVSNAQYRAFCAAVGADFPAESAQPDDHPVHGLTWHNANAYCRHHGLSLPTEAQWEYAAAGLDAREYPWGDELTDDALACWWFNRGPGEYTWPCGAVGGDVTWCGARDMAGNVREWCADYWASDYYAQSPAEDPTGPEGAGLPKVIRGACWHTAFDGSLRTWRRSFCNPSTDAYGRTGLRVCYTPEQ